MHVDQFVDLLKIRTLLLQLFHVENARDAE